MRESVRRAFVPFTAKFEGVVKWMYLDVKGLVTTAIGNLIDPMQYALTLPWKRPDGTDASVDEIQREWQLVKLHPTAAERGHRSLEHLTHLRLTDEGVRQVVERKLAEMEKYLQGRFAKFEEWPADAQLATLSMAWACGPAFRFPRLEAALLTWDFAAAERECTIGSAGNPGVVPRNVANKILYANAATVASSGLLEPAYEPEELYYPRALERQPPSQIQPDQLEPEPAIVHPKVPLINDPEPDSSPK